MSRRFSRDEASAYLQAKGWTFRKGAWRLHRAEIRIRNTRSWRWALLRDLAHVEKREPAAVEADIHRRLEKPRATTELVAPEAPTSIAQADAELGRIREKLRAPETRKAFVIVGEVLFDITRFTLSQLLGGGKR